MRRTFFFVLIAGVLIALGFRELRLHRGSQPETAYVGKQGATLWSSTAEVRIPVASLKYGDPVKVYSHYGDHVEVRTADGLRGWVSTPNLIDASLWHEAAELTDSTKTMMVEAAGETRVRSNLHSRPGREEPVIVQAQAGTPVLMLKREAIPAQVPIGSPDLPAKLEDWWLVRADVKNAGVVSGWLLGRFVDLDLPEALQDYQSAAGFRVVSWHTVNHAPDALGNLKPEYLVLGTKGPEGNPCDFTLIRVYTWSAARSRYETAYVENNVCGSLPLQLDPAKMPNGTAYFEFRNTDNQGVGARKYVMKQTTVLRVKTAPAMSALSGKS